MEEAYKELAAAVVKSAVGDLQGMFKKTMRLAALSNNGKLKDYIYGALDKSKEASILFTTDEIYAMKFFEDENAARELYNAVLDIEESPKEITQQRDYCRGNFDKLRVQVRNFRASYAREKENIKSL